MISMREFHAQFIERHDFQYEDLDFLSKTYPGILFKDIPEAWVCCIDEHLSKMHSLNKMVSISQIYGFPVIQYENEISDFDFAVLTRMERAIICMDTDLHKQRIADGSLAN